MRIDDDRGTVLRRRDHQRVVEAHPFQNSTTVRTERDRENLVRGLSADESDGSARGGSGGRRGNEEDHGEENEESAHVPDTGQPWREVP
jgi:hypothetical protein